MTQFTATITLFVFILIGMVALYAFFWVFWLMIRLILWPIRFFWSGITGFSKKI